MDQCISGRIWCFASMLLALPYAHSIYGWRTEKMARTCLSASFHSIPTYERGCCFAQPPKLALPVSLSMALQNVRVLSPARGGQLPHQLGDRHVANNTARKALVRSWSVLPLFLGNSNAARHDRVQAVALDEPHTKGSRPSEKNTRGARLLMSVYP